MQYRQCPAAMCARPVWQVMRVLGMPLPFYKSATLLLGFGLSPYVLARLWKIRPDVIHVAFPGASRPELYPKLLPYTFQPGVVCHEEARKVTPSAGCSAI